MARTLLIGDDTAKGLGDALAHVSPTGTWTGWVDSWPGADAGDWVATARVQHTFDSIVNSLGRGEAPPDLILISLGMTDVVTEPANAKAEVFQLLADDAVKLSDQAAKTGAKVAWILPTKIPNEGKSRGAIAAALAAHNVRTYHTDTRPYSGDASGNLSPATYQAWANDVWHWVPLGQLQIGPIGPRHPASNPFSEFVDIAVTKTGLSRNTTIGLGIAALFVIGLGIVGMASSKPNTVTPGGRDGPYLG